MKLLTVKEASDFLRCSEEHVRRLIRGAKLKAFSEGRRSGFRILEKDLEDYVQKRIDESMASKEGLPLFDKIKQEEGTNG